MKTKNNRPPQMENQRALNRMAAYHNRTAHSSVMIKFCQRAVSIINRPVRMALMTFIYRPLNG
jgi:hypothetical protein